MNKYDACKILGNSGEITKASIKEAYRAAAMKFHPDKGGSVEMMQMVNDAYSSLMELPEGESISIDAKHMGFGDELNEALNLIIRMEALNIEICGSWIWVGGDTKPAKEILKKARFMWAPKKGKWYFRPAGYKSFNRGRWSMDRIRDHYGSERVETEGSAKIAS